VSGSPERLGPMDGSALELASVIFYARGGDHADFPTWNCRQVPRTGDRVVIGGALWRVEGVRRRGPSSAFLQLERTSGEVPARTVSPGALLPGRVLVRFALMGDSRSVVPWVTGHVPAAGDAVELDDGSGIPVGEFWSVVEVCWVGPDEAVVAMDQAFSATGERRSRGERGSFWKRLVGG
jgi:hypothetical protein